MHAGRALIAAARASTGGMMHHALHSSGGIGGGLVRRAMMHTQACAVAVAAVPLCAHHGAASALTTHARTQPTARAQARRFVTAATGGVAEVGSAASAATSGASASVSTCPIPGGWYGRPATESVIRVTAGSATVAASELLKYLHNLTTLDMYAAVADTAAHGYSMFLNGKGRVLFDGIFAPIDAASAQWMRDAVQRAPDVTKGPAGVARAGTFAGPAHSPPKPEPATTPRGFYLTVNTAVLPLALAHLSQFNLRRKVVITDVTSHVDLFQVIPFQVVADQKRATALPSTAAGGSESTTLKRLLGVSSDAELSAASCISAAVDPRCPSMGIRVLAPRGTAPVLPSSFQLVDSPSFFSTYRILQGVSSAPIDLVTEKSLPLEHGLHELQGVSFYKGCYLGQELTARTYYQGVVRKKVWPAFVTPSTAAASSQQKGRPVRDLMANLPAAGLPSPSSDPLVQLQSFFPFFDPSFPPLPADTSIMRRPIAAPAADAPVSTPAAKEASHVLSASHNLVLVMLRTEHVEDGTQALRIDAREGQAELEVVPYQPAWFTGLKPEA